MIPIHDLLARIRWDPEFGRGRWEIAYLDHARPGLVRVPLEVVRMQPGDHFMVELVDQEGEARSIPYHRIREVWRDGERVWSRPAPDEAGSGPPRSSQV